LAPLEDRLETTVLPATAVGQEVVKHFAERLPPPLRRRSPFLGRVRRFMRGPMERAVAEFEPDRCRPLIG
jgi:hypothetical protein